MPVPKTPLSNSQVKKTEKETMKKTPKSKSTKTPSKVETPVKQEKKTPKSSKKASKENLTPAPGDKSKFQTPKKSESKKIKSKEKAEGGIILQHNDQLPDKAAVSLWHKIFFFIFLNRSMYKLDMFHLLITNFQLIKTNCFAPFSAIPFCQSPSPGG